jgi:hypothetical protein
MAMESSPRAWRISGRISVNAKRVKPIDAMTVPKARPRTTYQYMAAGVVVPLDMGGRSIV